MDSAWERPVFMVGPQRTGSTLVGRILASAPGAAFTVNGKLLYQLMHWVRDGVDRQDERAHLRADEILHALRRKPILGVPDDFVDTIAAPALEGLARDLAEDPAAARDRKAVIRDGMRRAYSRLNPAPAFWGDKYNEYVLSLDEIRDIYPRARFVATSREAEAAARSMLLAFQARAWCPRDLAGAIGKHEAWRVRWRAFAEGLPDGQALEIDYQRLLADPAAELRILSRFVGLPDVALEHAAEWVRRAPATSAASAP